MSKYSTNFSDHLPKLLQSIANELAEANRLKRIEIDLRMTIEIDPEQLSIFEQSYLEDRA